MPDSAAGLSLLSYTVPGWLGLTSARKADHLLGFSICSWEGGLAEQITKQAPAPAPAPAPDEAGHVPPVVGEALPGAGLRWAWSSRHLYARADRSPPVLSGPARPAGKCAGKAQKVSLAGGRTKVRVLSLGLLVGCFASFRLNFLCP